MRAKTSDLQQPLERSDLSGDSDASRTEEAAYPRAEAEAQLEGHREALAGREASREVSDFSHYPEQVRDPLKKVAAIYINKDVHTLLRPFINKNKKVKRIDKLLEKGKWHNVAVPFSLNSFHISKSRNLAEWKARAHSAGAPLSIITVIANPVEAVHILVLKFITDTEPNKPIALGLEGREHFIDEAFGLWLAQL